MDLTAEYVLDSRDPRTGETFGTVPASTTDDAADVCRLAGKLFQHSRQRPSDASRRLLYALADELEASRPDVVSVLDAETALGEGRLTGELARTAFQLRALAEAAVSERVVQPMVDLADPQRVPPRTDQRRRNVPLGPVAVFAASNFPLAFGLLGGDTASALAAGCPVVAKAHPAHPRASEVLRGVISRAVAGSGVAAEWLQVVQGDGPEIGIALVEHEDIAAVGFTGSTGGGLALVAAASRRDVPIPVYAEMGSVNPSFVAPAAAARRATEIGRSWADTLVANAGQFCTKPGMLIVPPQHARETAEAALARLAEASIPPLLSRRLVAGYTAALAKASEVADVTSRVVAAMEDNGFHVPASVLEADMEDLIANPVLAEEIFGPAGLIVRCPPERAAELGTRLPGSLSMAIMAEPEDAEWVGALLPTVEQRAGRIVYNAWPTGVSVGWGTVHGGPWPATSAPATTSVGMASIWRWTRPVAYERFPEHLLPSVLRG